MSTYEIKRWDAVIFGTGTVASPMLYIKPDKRFIDFIHKNNNIISCTVKGSNTPFDDYPVAGFVYKSSDVPNYRPNFFNTTGYYAIVLIANWIKYPHPCKLGTVTINELPGLEKKGSVENFKNYMNYEGGDSPSEGNYTAKELVAISMGIVALFVAVVCLCVLFGKKNDAN